MRNIVTWVVVIVLAVVGYKMIWPWAQERFATRPAEGSRSTGDPSCVKAAERASETWGNGLGRFVNPPHDADAWSTFSNDVVERIGEAESACGCEDDSCEKAREAMNRLRAIHSDLDTALRNNSGVPDDIVQRQEAVDNLIDQARESLVQ